MVKKIDDSAVLVASEDSPELPTSVSTRTALIGGIFTILLFAALREARVIAVPFVLALVLKLVLHPLARRLERLNIPRSAASASIILFLLCLMVGFGAILSDPAATWGDKISRSVPKLHERFSVVTKPAEQTQKLLSKADNIASTSDHKVIPVAVQGSNFSDKIIDETQSIIGGLLTTLLILMFMLSAGDTFLRRFVEILPKFKDKRQAVDLAHDIEHDISIYLLTITAMNVLVGVTAGFAMFVAGVEDPVLWGFLAFLLNFIPIMGPFSGIVVFALVGTISIQDSWVAFLPAGLYIFIHILEGSIITPMLLARRFTLNPVLVITSLIFWYWMWGIPGAMLAMPMLAILKLICDRIDRLSTFGHILEG